jgi:hypothetical protein
METAEPMRTMDLVDMLEPNLKKSKILSPLPIRVKLRTDSALPKLVKSRIELALPHLIADLIDNELPIDINESTLALEPSLVIDRILILDPMST